MQPGLCMHRRSRCIHCLLAKGHLSLAKSCLIIGVKCSVYICARWAKSAPLPCMLYTGEVQLYLALSDAASEQSHVPCVVQISPSGRWQHSTNKMLQQLVFEMRKRQKSLKRVHSLHSWVCLTTPVCCTGACGDGCLGSGGRCLPEPAGRQSAGDCCSRAACCCLQKSTCQQRSVPTSGLW